MHHKGSGMDLKLLGHVTWKLSQQHNLISIQIICINVYKSITQQQTVFIMQGTFLRILSLNSQFRLPPINSKIKVKLGRVIGSHICRSRLMVLFQSVSPVHKGTHREPEWWILNYLMHAWIYLLMEEQKVKCRITHLCIVGTFHPWIPQCVSRKHNTPHPHSRVQNTLRTA